MAAEEEIEKVKGYTNTGGISIVYSV